MHSVRTPRSTPADSAARRPSEEQRVRVTVNGAVREATVASRLLLVDWLRHGLRLTGTHIGCEQGVCGACTVRVDGELARACILLVAQLDGCTVETIESVADGERLDAVQVAFHEEHGLQCGFCTPGMVLATQSLLAERPDPSDEEIREHLSGNVCRCTGYVGIVAAVRRAARMRAARDGTAPSATATEAEGGRDGR